MKKAIPGFKLRKHFSVYFKLYQRLVCEMQANPEWKSKLMNLEIIEAYLKKRNPDWYFAPYLEKAEAERRNKSYKKK